MNILKRVFKTEIHHFRFNAPTTEIPFNLNFKNRIEFWNWYITTFGLILLVISVLNCQPVFAGELCDCFGECVPVYQRDVSVNTKRLIKNMYGYPSYAQMDIDHKIPLCLGGSNNIENLQPLSKNNHKIKTDHDLMLFNYVRQCMMTIKEAQSEVNNWK